jgi:prepilin-type N-terminal cleavage/methylation domain-containing protein/prepilin-type processing-associated H-X9-DG protein
MNRRPQDATVMGAGGRRSVAFTLVELLIVIAVIGILASLLMTALAESKAKAQGVFCLSNVKQLSAAWLMYADDHNGRLANNFGGVDAQTNINWAADLLDWDLTSDNTNLADLTQASLGPYVSQVAAVYHCPADAVLSSPQRAASWQNRARSYSMNASVGDAGQISASGVNTNNPDYVQFFSLNSIPAASRIFVFVDEHPDSIYDGYFVNRAYSEEWLRLPAAYHDGAASLSFADGHAEIHEWLCATTRLPPVPDAAPLPVVVGADHRDFNWIIGHMSLKVN